MNDSGIDSGIVHRQVYLKFHRSQEGGFRGVANEAEPCEHKRMKQPPCPHCGQDQSVIKSGFNRTRSQRYRCQSCRRSFTPDPRLEGSVPAVRRQALPLSWEGTSFRASGRFLGLPHQSVSNGVTEAANTLPAQTAAPTLAETIEVDELSTLVQQKKTRATS
jgi:transposase